jgi:hypothetical protein
MSTLSAKDRASLCMFSFADGRRCRTPRIRNHPHFCYYHAEKEARARAAQSLGTDLARYFSGEYLSACDLSTALGCLIPAVVRGDVKPKVARTVAYMAQTLLQSIHVSQDEYINAFGTDGWRKSIRNSVNSNHNYRFPPHRSGGLQACIAPQPQHPRDAQPQPQPAQPPASNPDPTPVPTPPPPASPPAQTPTNCHSERSEESAFSSSPAAPQTQPKQPVPPPHNPLPPTGAEFAQQVLARNSSRLDSTRPVHPRSTGETAGEQTAQPVTPIAKPTPPTQPSPVSATNVAPPANNTPRVPATQATYKP